MTRNKPLILCLFALFFILNPSAVFSLMQEEDSTSAQKPSCVFKIETLTIEREGFVTVQKRFNGRDLFFLKPKSEGFSLSEQIAYDPQMVIDIIEKHARLEKDFSNTCPLDIPFHFIDPHDRRETQENFPFHSILKTYASRTFHAFGDLQNSNLHQKLAFVIEGGHPTPRSPKLTLKFRGRFTNWSRTPLINIDTSQNQAKIQLHFSHPLLKGKRTPISLAESNLTLRQEILDHPNYIFYNAPTKQFFRGVSQAVNIFTLPDDIAERWEINPEPHQKIIPVGPLSHSLSSSSETFVPSPAHTGFYKVSLQENPVFNVFEVKAGKTFMAMQQACQLGSVDTPGENPLETIRLTSSPFEIFPTIPYPSPLPSGFYNVADSKYNPLFLSDAAATNVPEFPFSSASAPSFSMLLSPLSTPKLWIESFSSFNFLGELSLHNFQLSEENTGILMLSQAIGNCPSLLKLKILNCFADFYSSSFFGDLAKIKREGKLLKLTELEFYDPLSMGQFKDLIESIRILSLTKIGLSLPDPLDPQISARNGILLGISAGTVTGTVLSLGAVFGGSPVILPTLIAHGTAGIFLTNGVVAGAGSGALGAIVGKVVSWRRQSQSLTEGNPVILDALKLVLSVPTLETIHLKNPNIRDANIYRPFIEMHKSQNAEVDLNDSLKIS
ncbi:MAG: hypothetical protein B7Y25_00365 [Alphaproteobacteria bacterium 16-39-46]|nr:MAG: hypothetical protein B7Y25_00365 [Alphaproteobacteria bacterium 16-39-46]OZA44444.1 MAG: hypothetical protein B7X84_00555 [Alphaproteobacteria bacterium 17-39-52]HQS83330.1 hypothetical protein [Alphaproteobacteria bacterium]HQS93649.1 hypothetical protein [Alphaproteobacteria bacterium]